MLGNLLFITYDYTSLGPWKNDSLNEVRGNMCLMQERLLIQVKYLGVFFIYRFIVQQQ